MAKDTLRGLLDEAEQWLCDNPNAQCRELAARIRAKLDKQAPKAPKPYSYRDEFLDGILRRPGPSGE